MTSSSRLRGSLIGASLLAAFAPCAQADSTPSRLRLGAFVDAYYAFDFERPFPNERAFATQAVRHNEFNVNLAFLEAKLEETPESRSRGRLAFQAGTSVQANYSGEPTQGSYSGPSLARHLQEAVVGYRVAPGWWVDAGIYFSHVGLESWISSDNPVYTRSLVAEYSPYYQSGLRSGWQLSERFSAQLHLINGWQNISENGGGKSVGTQLAYAIPSLASVSYSTILGDEGGFRHYHDLVVRASVGERVELGLELDYGRQHGGGTPSRPWAGLAVLPRVTVAEGWSLGGRLERYCDPSGVVARTAGGIGLNAWGGSLGVDRRLTPELLLRGELRALWATDAVFPGHDGSVSRDRVGVISLAMRL